jgi:acyl-coenzyme A thioesterase PaaI-like protein
LTLAHHELCFGCGNANLFGLQMELEPADEQPGAVTGRFFLKQDHQGRPGEAHDGVMASALQEAMAMALHSRGVHARTRRLEVTLLEPAPLGVFVRVDARVEEGGVGELTATASGRSVGEDARELARASAMFEQV